MERQFVRVDEWVPKENELIIQEKKGAIIMPISQAGGVTDPTGMFDIFLMAIKKRCYNSDDNRKHTAHYLNYFVNFYDPERELLWYYYMIKYMIDVNTEFYSENDIRNDICKYILSPTMLAKVARMNDDNYFMNLDDYNKAHREELQYNDEHGKLMMKISLLMNISIPLLTHYVHRKTIVNINAFIISVFEIFMHIDPNYDFEAKLYRTTQSTIGTSDNVKKDPILWQMNDIQGKTPETHANYTVSNIILQVMPKYTYCQNLACYNFRTIENTLRHQITDIRYGNNYVSLSSSIRDEDNNSELDKYESMLIKKNENLFIQNEINYQNTMKNICAMYGPFRQDHIEFYRRELSKGYTSVINEFQKDLIFLLFFKFFGEPESIKKVTEEDYIKLIIASKRMLSASGLRIMPYIISSKINRLVDKKNLNKREKEATEASPTYQKVKAKYRNPKMEDYIMSKIAVILSSDFTIIDPELPSENGKVLPLLPEFVREEFLLYTLFI